MCLIMGLKLIESVLCSLWLAVPKKSESADVEQPKIENEATNEEEINVTVSPPADRKTSTSKPKVFSLYYTVWNIWIIHF